MTLVSTLETLAVDTWERLRDARALGILFGEETITDILLLDLKRKASPRSRVIQTPKSKEKDNGTDWEWWLGSNRRGWIRLAIQAKKLHLEKGKYTTLSHKVGTQLQINLLEKYALANHAIPAYVLYNHLSPSIATKGWNCCDSEIDVRQLACTVTPSSVVRKAIVTLGAKRFIDIHGDPQTIPWRCLAKCKRLRGVYDAKRLSPMSPESSLELLGRHARVYARLPPEVDAGRDTGRVEHFSAEFYDLEVGLPRRIVVLESTREEDSELVG